MARGRSQSEEGEEGSGNLLTTSPSLKQVVELKDNFIHAYHAF